MINFTVLPDDFFIPVDDAAPSVNELTPYDRHHLITYYRLIEADLSDLAWQEAARLILHRDPIRAPRQSKRCWESHLSRAHWMMTRGLIGRSCARRSPAIGFAMH